MHKSKDNTITMKGLKRVHIGNVIITFNLPFVNTPFIQEKYCAFHRSFIGIILLLQSWVTYIIIFVAYRLR